MSKETEAQKNIKKDFDTWEKRFEEKLKIERPYNLTDTSITTLLNEIRTTFLLNQYPVRYKFDKVISALVLEIASHCASEGTEFPELSPDDLVELRRIGKDIAEVVKAESEDEQACELGMVPGESITELTKTVLGYEGEGPEPFVPTPEQLTDHERRL